MSPERISGRSYSFDSDIWSLGLTLVECAIGRYPYSAEGGKYTIDYVAAMMTRFFSNYVFFFLAVPFFELLGYIVKSPAPTLPPGQFSPEFCSFINCCLQKEPEERPPAQDLLDHEFIRKYANDNVGILHFNERERETKEGMKESFF